MHRRNVSATIYVHSGPKGVKGHDFVSKNDQRGKPDCTKRRSWLMKKVIWYGKGCDVKPRNPHLFVTLLPTNPAYTRAGQLGGFSASRPLRSIQSKH
jgi:hypothetical protein